LSKPAVLLVSSDLFWLGKVRQVADHAGWTVLVPERKTDVTQLLLDDATKLVLVDLHHPKFEFVETIRLVRGTRWDADLVCFGHHTDSERLQKAKAAGAKQVWPNSELDRRLPELFSLR
jgi:DNA-binding response OmpR family regulator